MKQLLSILYMLLLCSSILAQKIKFSEKLTDDNGNVSFVRLTDPLKDEPSAQIGLIKNLLPPALQQLIEVRFSRNFSDDMGFTHNHYKFFFKQIEITGADFVVHSKKGKIEYANGVLPVADYSAVATTAAIEERTAITVAEKKLTESNTERKKVTADVIGKSKGLFVLLVEKKAVLAYRVEVISRLLRKENFYYINAADGTVLMESSSGCNYADDEDDKISPPPPFLPGNAATLYSGTQIITGELAGSQYRLKDMRRTLVPIRTLNANNWWWSDELPVHSTEFYDNDNNWTAAEHPSDRMALDAHWAVEQSFDYWYNVHARNSYDDHGSEIVCYVHADLVDAASWLVDIHALRLSDGQTSYRPLTSLDVVAHEIGHGVTQFTCNLPGGTSNEAGSLNEGFSDIWGACAENYSAPGVKNPWVNGEDIALATPFYNRNLLNPFLSKKPQPNTYLGTNWMVSGTPNYDVHINAGVLNHWFYLLVTGGTGWNNGLTSHATAGQGFQWSLNGLGWRNAERIVYRTEQLLNSSANYAAVRTMSIQAAKELFGAGSCEQATVTKAWYAVGVGANWASGSPVAVPTINGQGIICTSPETYFINYSYYGAPACGGESIVWSASPTGLVNFSCTSCTQTTLTATGNGIITLTATVTSGSQVQTVTKKVKVGTYSNYAVSVTGPYMVPLNYSASYSVDLGNYPGISNMSWSWPSPPSYSAAQSWSMVYNGGSNYVVLRSGAAASTGNVIMSFSACGTNNILATKWVAWGYGGPTYRISPNPATNVIQVEQLDALTEKSVASSSIQMIELTDKMGIVVLRRSYAKGTAGIITLPVSQLRSDVYTVRIFDGMEWKPYKVIVRH